MKSKYYLIFLTSLWISFRRRPTDEALTNSPVANETSCSVVWVTFIESLIDSSQVQIDSVIQIERSGPVFLQKNSKM